MYQPYPTGTQMPEVQRWLAGLTAVIFLWRRPSTAFFKGAALKENNQ
jgi:hypothetical protein